MSAISVRIKDAELKRLLNKLEKKSANLRPLFATYWGEIMEEVMLNFRREGSYGDVLSGKPTSHFIKWKKHSSLTSASRKAKNRSGKILQESGNLAAGVGTIRKITGRGLECGVGVHYGAAQHFGAVIRPKKAKFLTIPFPGVRGRARDYENTFVRSHVIFQKLPDGGIKPLFMLKKKVTIPARPFMTIGVKRINHMTELAANYLIGVS